jgi:hypothetical protein
MSIALAEMVLMLQSDVIARDSVPTDEQYQRCIRQAVSDYGRRNSREKLWELSVVSGTAEYALPDDFIQIIRWEVAGLQTLYPSEGTIVTSDGLIPTSSDWEESTYISEGELIFHPTPTYSGDRDVWYSAGFYLDPTDNSYAELTDSDVDILMHKARALALELQANKASQEAWQYQIGDERVNKEKLADSLRAAAKLANEEYEAAVKSSSGMAAIGMRARYDSMGR